ncbi:hypothetical protein [Streptomyces sp. NPDC059611]|uniref:hypothetical protein n=1 Tax=unclassified Streptomyces TaxID=2593676 RepID=UPI0036BE4C75
MTLAAPAGSALAFLFDIVATSARLTLEEERDVAQTAAADHVYTVYPNILGQAVDHDA